MRPRHDLPDCREKPDDARGPRALARGAVPEAPGAIGAPTPGGTVVVHGAGMPLANGQLGDKSQPGGLRYLHRQALCERAAIA